MATAMGQGCEDYSAFDHPLICELVLASSARIDSKSKPDLN
jgi:hypothetical protein